MTSAMRSPTEFSPGWHLQKQRDNEYGYRDVPIEKGRIEDVAKTLPENVKKMLMNVNIRSIDPVELSQLTFALHREGYLSHDAWAQLGEFQIDYTGLIDPLAETRDALRTIRGVDDVMYALCMSLYETAIDAIVGIEELIDYLNKPLLDVHA